MGYEIHSRKHLMHTSATPSTYWNFLGYIDVLQECPSPHRKLADISREAYEALQGLTSCGQEGLQEGTRSQQ